MLPLDVKALERAARKQAQLVNYRLRRLRQHLDDADIRQFRHLVGMLRHEAPDVIYLGDSAVSLVSPLDSDKRPLCQMVSDGVGADVSLYALHGAGYQPGMYTEFLRAVANTSRRPVVIVPLCVRLGTLPWHLHPYFARRESIEYMHTADLTAPLHTIRAHFPSPTRSAYDEHMARLHPTWAGELTVGEYVRPLKAPGAAGLDSESAERLRYAYHHGGAVEQGYLDSITAMGRALSDLGCPVVVYRTPVPVERGRQLYGQQFWDLINRNFEVMERALTDELGSELKVLQTGTVCRTEDFLDPEDASEHLNESGRRRVAAEIIDGVATQLARR